MVVVVATLLGTALVAFDGPAIPAARIAQTGGEAVLASDLPLPVVDLGDGLGAASLAGVNHDISAGNYSDVLPLPLDHGTLLVNRTNGAFNFLEPGDVVADGNPGGVALGPTPAGTRATAYPSGDAAFIVRFETTRVVVDLVDPALVLRAAHHPGSRLRPLGFATLRGNVTSPSTQVAATPRGLYLLLARSHASSELVALLRAPGHGLGLRVHLVASIANPSALERVGNEVAIDSAGRLEVLEGLRLQTPRRRHRAGVPVAIWPVADASAPGWFVEEEGTRTYLLAGLRHPERPIRGLGAQAPLGIIRPVEDEGRLFTMGLTGTRSDPLLVISLAHASLGRVAGAPQYPLAKSESPTLAATTVRAYGTEVIYDCPNALLAVVVFTGGQRRPVVINKGVLPSVDPNAPAGAIGPTVHHRARAAHQTAPATPKPTAPSPAVQTVTTAVNCATTDQKPSIPTVTSVVPGPQSATIAWSYPLISADSCEPSTYEVAIAPENGAPPPATPVIAVNGQTQAVITGLHSGQTYQVTVTAFIGTSSTPSAPITFTTTPEGADAPLTVTSIFEPGQGWLVSWTSCQGSACNVPAASWTVTGALCGPASGFVGTPPSVTVSASADQALVPLTPSLIGESLAFSVAGTSARGLVGNPTASGACQLGYQAPSPADLVLSAAETPTGGGQASATLTVLPATGTSLVVDLGSPGVGFRFCLATSPGGACLETQATDSPTASFTGLALGATYFARVELVPSVDPSLATTLTDATPLSATVPWPTVTTTVEGFSADKADPDLGAMSVSLSTTSPMSVHAAVEQASLVCQSTALALTPSTTTLTLGGPGPAPTVTFEGISLLDVAPPCQLSLTLASTAQVDPFSTPSTTTTASVPAPSPAPSGAPVFGLALSGPEITSTPTSQCSPTSSTSTDPSLTLTICAQQSGEQGFQPPWGFWTLEQLTATLGTSTPCDIAPPASPVTSDAPISISLTSCLTGGFYDGETIGVTEEIAWSYLGTTELTPLSIQGTFQASTTTFAAATVSGKGVVTVAVDQDSPTGEVPVDGGTFTVTDEGQAVPGCTSVTLTSAGTGSCTIPTSTAPSGLEVAYAPASTSLLPSSTQLEQSA
jgi:hypothetical protein